MLIELSSKNQQKVMVVIISNDCSEAIMAQSVAEQPKLCFSCAKTLATEGDV
jgi:formylmethanofuran dehydrogenase subunit E